MTIRQCDSADVSDILVIINDAAEAYRGVIPDDCFHDPYMSSDELQREIDTGVCFWGAETDEILVGVVGIQELEKVALIRHAYVRTAMQNQGLGADLLQHLRGLSRKPLLVGTWATAGWAIRFYQRHGFEVAPSTVTPALLKRFWSISDRQIETSVVLAEAGKPPLSFLHVV